MNTQRTGQDSGLGLVDRAITSIARIPGLSIAGVRMQLEEVLSEAQGKPELQQSAAYGALVAYYQSVVEAQEKGRENSFDNQVGTVAHLLAIRSQYSGESTTQH
ncbi:MAG: hypothetical protein H6502_04780 [Candidatus Woesearchaeota archaeon]|nr:MAG: hypothetical protein H6502_04780 [Candidatus Woesearchaeota archaeon]